MDCFPSKVYLSSGSNMGDRLSMLQCAVQILGEYPDISVLRTSSVYETEPWGLTEQEKFLNIMVEVETALRPLELLNAVKQTEMRLGRTPTIRWGPRVIDIDLILWGTLQMRTPSLILPHESFRNRAFVLVPFAELAPEAIDPVSGKSIAELLKQTDVNQVARYADMRYS